jgi:hypothetical protein
MRLQQYRLIPKLSKTSLAFSPVLILRANSSHRSPISLPHVKHLTGIIISLFSLPVAFLLSRACAWTSELFGFFYSGVSGDHGSIVFSENRSKVAALCPF